MKDLQKNGFIQAFFPLLLILIVSFGNYYFQKDFSNANTFSKTLRLSKDVEYLISDGKSKSRYYQFIFDDYSKKFRLEQRDYQFANNLLDVKELKKCDLVICYFEKENIEELRKETFFNKYNRIVNISFNGGDIINYEYRNKEVRKSRKQLLFSL